MLGVRSAVALSFSTLAWRSPRASFVERQKRGLDAIAHEQPSPTYAPRRQQSAPREVVDRRAGKPEQRGDLSRTEHVLSRQWPRCAVPVVRSEMGGRGAPRRARVVRWPLVRCRRPGCASWYGLKLPYSFGMLDQPNASRGRLVDVLPVVEDRDADGRRGHNERAPPVRPEGRTAGSNGDYVTAIGIRAPRVERGDRVSCGASPTASVKAG